MLSQQQVISPKKIKFHPDLSPGVQKSRVVIGPRLTLIADSLVLSTRFCAIGHGWNAERITFEQMVQIHSSRTKHVEEQTEAPNY